MLGDAGVASMAPSGGSEFHPEALSAIPDGRAPREGARGMLLGPVLRVNRAMGVRYLYESISLGISDCCLMGGGGKF